MEHASIPHLAGAVAAAFRIGATSADSVALILFHRAERPAYERIS